MMYLGGKFRLRKQIGAYINSAIGDLEYLEPFVGAGNILAVVEAKKRTALDANESLITMYRALQSGWRPPSVVSPEEYEHYRKLQDPRDPMTAFVGFGASFGGKWFGGYARSKQGQDYVGGSANSLMRKFATMDGVTFMCADYRDLDPHGAFIYCDPPYSGTTGYAGVGDFNNAEFWDTMRVWSKDNIVLVSEITAPKGFRAVAEFPTRRGMRTSIGGAEIKAEKLFQYLPTKAIKRTI